MYRVISANDTEINDQHWQGFFQLLTELRERYHTPYTLVSWEVTRDRTLSRQKAAKGIERSFFFSGDRCVAWAGLEGRNVGTPNQTAFFIFDLLGEFAEPNLERMILSQIEQWMRRHGLTESFSVVNDAHREQVVQRWGAKELSQLNEFVLERKTANVAVIDDWFETIPAQHPNLELRFFQILPDAYVEPFTALLTETLRSIPAEARGGLPFHAMVQDEREAEAWRRKNNQTLYKYLLFDPNDRMVGLTLLNVDLREPSNVFQLMTGIVGDYRGKKLGRWLKAAMFRKIGEDFPTNERITTSVRGLNRPMQAINEAMGFRLFRQGREFQLTSEIIERYLAVDGRRPDRS